MTGRIIEGDCVERMRELPEAAVDAVVCDPPYGLSREPDIAEVLTHWLAGDDYAHRGGGFMGKSWDSFVPGPVYWREALRVLKPGGHLLAFGGTRTFDLLVIAVRLAGFEVRDTVAWMYGSGFPKSLSVGKAIDAPYLGPECEDGWITPQAREHGGEGTALKPAHEPIVVARKPLAGAVAANVLGHGTGALNIDGCRIEGAPPSVPQPDFGSVTARATRLDATARNGEMSMAAGRWPANVVLDEEAAGMLDQQTGELGRSVGGRIGNAGGGSVSNVPTGEHRAGDPGFGDSGGASRFFYVAKASRAERNAGPDGFEERPSYMVENGSKTARSGDGVRRPRTTTTRNAHPTVKPVALMRWLVRLVTPPGGKVLDPFAGSGTTGIACALEGAEFVGIERQGPRFVAEHPGEDDYVAIAEARIAWWEAHPEAAEVGIGEVAKREAQRAALAALPTAEQLGLI